jgi:5-hydroxyisourate hydrolase
MSGITTHVLDTQRGQPASGVPLLLEVQTGIGQWKAVATASTDATGRAAVVGSDLTRGFYRLTFDTGAYFRAWSIEGFFPEVQVVFEVRDPVQHYHVPLLLSPYSYSTYRGA